MRASAAKRPGLDAYGLMAALDAARKAAGDLGAAAAVDTRR
ncbi:hypothetical protein ACFVVU_15630 [Kitasatospora sp. NPDC057965]